ncbi:hypothetical protein [Thalassotalea aquiviva]|uniref:hypothetical protein n=1 Tax=Thalassotalea aquiviva TaxID=3242415 RepID=UPI00352B4D8A
MATHKNTKKNNFIEVWNKLTQSQKNMLFKLGLKGWRLDYGLCQNTDLVIIVHEEGQIGTVNSFGEVEFLEVPQKESALI